jgi:monoterpene epsilon-lactone hydrolase
MASLQARALGVVLRLVVKRHLLRHRANNDDLIAAMRRSFEAGAARQAHVPQDIRIVPIDQAGVRGEWVMRRDGAIGKRALLYVHGGGMVACRPLGYRTISIPLARATGAPVFVVDYRRAPEHRFPAALCDVVAAYDAMRLRLPASGIALAGDSAGGNLALATLLKLRERGHSRPVAATIALSPWTDLEGTGASLRRNARRDVLLVGPSEGAQLSLAYADAAQLRDPLVSPLYGDYSGGPPLLVFASSSEMLLDDALRLARSTRAQGVATTLVVTDGMPHVWPIFPMLPEARDAVATMATFLEEIWAEGSTSEAAKPGGAPSHLENLLGTHH